MLVVLFVLIFLILFTLGFSYYAYRIAFMPLKRAAQSPVPREDTAGAVNTGSALSAVVLPPGMTWETMHPGIRKSMDKMLSYPCEPVTVTAFDGKKLFARYYHTTDGAPLQILFHGYKSNPFVDCSGGTYLAKEMGHNVLVVDQRSHGQSEGRAITFGVLERKDCLSWIHFARERFGEQIPIIISGLSMGAATVLMTADLNLPCNVKGIMADCPYSSPKDIILKVSQDMHFIPELIYPFVKLGARLFAGFRLEEASALTSVQNAQVPILLIHGESDDFVPCNMSREIQKYCASPITLVTIPGAGHGKSYLADPKRYEAEVKKFATKVLTPKKCTSFSADMFFKGKEKAVDNPS